MPKAETVTVTRGWADARTVCVPIDELRYPHMARRQGGDWKRLPRPTLAAYMSCAVVPTGVPFGHSCEHGDGPHQIIVLVPRSLNRRAAYAALRAQVRSRSAWYRARRRERLAS